MWSASFDALGNIEKLHEDKFHNPFRFQGQCHDEDLDLYYNRHRYFDPATGAFISADPLGIAGGVNLYRYAPNVWGWIDPLGLCGEGAKNTTQIGYHATNPGNVESILANGFRESQAGRLGGGGVYVNNTSEGAIAEYMAHSPGGPAPTVLSVQYNPGLNYQISLPTVPSTFGPLPFAADTLTAPSVRLPGTFNTIIRNETGALLP